MRVRREAETKCPDRSPPWFLPPTPELEAELAIDPPCDASAKRHRRVRRRHSGLPAGRPLAAGAQAVQLARLRSGRLSSRSRAACCGGRESAGCAWIGRHTATPSIAP